MQESVRSRKVRERDGREMDKRWNTPSLTGSMNAEGSRIIHVALTD